MAIKERGADAALFFWRDTTYDTVYSGVESVHWDWLRMVYCEDKPRMLGIKTRELMPGDCEACLPPMKILDNDRGLPLYWAERETVKLW